MITKSEDMADLGLNRQCLPPKGRSDLLASLRSILFETLVNREYKDFLMAIKAHG